MTRGKGVDVIVCKNADGSTAAVLQGTVVMAYGAVAGAGGGTIAIPVPSPGVVGASLNGGSSTPSTGSKGYTPRMPYAGVIKGWLITADQVGSIQFDVRKCTVGTFPASVSIVAAAPPKLAAAQMASDVVLAGWDTAVAVGDIFEIVVTSVSGCKRITLELDIAKS